MNIGRYAAIILSAGFSSRMGAFKPLLPLGEEMVADHVAATFLDNGVEVILVTGWRGDELAAAIRRRDITIVENPDYREGMFTSVRAGVRRLEPHHHGFFIMPVDIPLVRPATIRRLMNAFASHPESIIYPVFDGQRGHPPLLPASLTPAILRWSGEGGLATFLEKQQALALEVSVPDSHILFNLNTPEDYAVLQERLQRYHRPTDEECRIIWHIAGTPPEVQRHGTKTAEVAVKIGGALALAGERLDLEAVRLAALLHDVAKGRSKHDIVGGQMLGDMGFPRIGEIVAAHTDLLEGDEEISLEAKVVYLADKFVGGERPVSIEERYQSRRPFATAPEIEAKIQRRKERALRIKAELEALAHRPLEEVIFE